MTAKQLFLATLALAATTTTIYYLFKTPQSTPSSLKAFLAFKRKHNRSHSTKAEFLYRFSIFQSNLQKIDTHNKKKRSFTMEVNKFADFTFEEFKNKFLSKKPIAFKPFKKEREVTNNSKDWVAEKKVSRVKNQEQCGSCWAFSTTGSMESAYAIYKNEDLEFSEQELVDCAGDYGNDGCDGGIMSAAYDYIIDNSIANENYRYTGRDGRCKSSRYPNNRKTVALYTVINPVDVDGLVAAVNKQPVSVAIEVQDDFMFYSGGIYESDDEDCGGALNHGVLAVGFSDGQNGFIKVKNSWGPDWGEEGYVRMSMGTGSGTCGIANDSDVYPSL